MNAGTRLSSAQVLLRLVGFLRHFPGWVALSIFLGVGTVASGIGLLGTSADLIARAALHPSVAELQVAIVGVRFFGITRGLFRYLERLVSHSVNFRLLAQLRGWFYRALEPLAPARLSAYRGGDLLNRAVGDIETLENFYVRALTPPVTALVITLGMALFVGRWDARLGLVLAGGLLAAGLALPLLARSLGKRPARVLVQARAQQSAALVDLIQGMADLLVYGQAQHRLADLRQLNARAGRAQLNAALVSAFGSAVNLLISNLTLLAVLLIAIPLVASGKMEGTLLAVLSLLTLASFEAVNPLSQAAQNLENSLESARRLFGMTDAPPPVQEASLPVDPPRSASLVIRGLNFTYADDLPPAMQDLNLEIPAGRRVALVGPSGAGKSTLINLLLRFYDVEAGAILLDGRDLRSFSPGQVRAQMAVISQSTYLFTATLRQNLLLAKPGAAASDLEQALAQAGLQDWLASLPQGLDTWLGERGLHMSGGERQRLAVARALLQDAPLFLLDEPAAHLDALTEQRMMRTLAQITRGRGVLLVTHHLAGLDWMDEIIVLQQGRVVERGTHAQLVTQPGLYARMWALQSRVLPDFEAQGTFFGPSSSEE